MVPVKITMLVVNLSVILFDNVYATLFFILVYTALFTSVKAGRLLFSTILLYAPPIFIVAALAYLTGGLTMHSVNLYLYGYSLILSVLLLFSTTRRGDMLRLLSRVKLDLAYSLTYNVFEELKTMVDSKIARGWDPGLNPFKYYVVIVDAIKLTIVRLSEVEDALRARGVE